MLTSFFLTNLILIATVILIVSSVILVYKKRELQRPETIVCPTKTEIPDEFITSWNLVSNTITLPFSDTLGEPYSVFIDWGDGSALESYNGNGSTPPSHTYATLNNYLVSITLGPLETMPSLDASLAGTNFTDNFTGIIQAGKPCYTLKSLDNAFKDCGALKFMDNSDSELYLSSEWTSGITDMTEAFENCTTFNYPLDNWDVSNVSSLDSMFQGASAFNSSLTGWQITRSGVNANSMFESATAFNQPLNSWNTDGITNMRSMFLSATAFNQEINLWNVSNVTSMSQMFLNATSFNRNINEWDVGNVTDMNSLFNNASDFKGDVSGWNVSSVNTMNNMFLSATDFNGNIGGWNVHKVTSMNNMFQGASSAFNQELSGWNFTSAISTVGGFESFLGGSGTLCQLAQDLTNFSALIIKLEADALAGGVATEVTHTLNYSNTITLIGDAAVAEITLSSAPYNWTINQVAP